MPTKRPSRIAATLKARLSAKKEAGTRPFLGPVRFSKEKDPATGLRSIEIVGNSGTPFKYYGENIVLDFGRSTVESKIPILRDHDTSRILGHTTKSSKSFVATGVMSGQPDEVEEVLSMADRGYPWQSSIYLDTQGYKEYDADHKDAIEVNGHSYKAPLLVVWGHIREYTVTSLGADENTSSTFFSWNPNMADDLDLEVEDDADDLELDAEESDLDDEDDDLELEDESADEGWLSEIEADDVEDEDDAALQTAITARRKAAKHISRMEIVAKRNGGSEAHLDKALKAGLSPEQFELALLRLNRPKGEHRPAKDDVNKQFAVLEAGLYLGLGVDDPKQIKTRKAPTAETFQRAEDEYGQNGVGLQELFLEAARMHGHKGKEYARFGKNPRNVLKAAFSTHELSGILSNVQNTLIRGAFMAVESAWRRIAKIGTLNDFKTHTRYYMTGHMTFEKLGNDGEIKHGTWGEGSYSASLETYAKMYALSRKDLINDDLGALAQLTARLGRGAALKVNDVFWTKFLDGHATDFTAARKNYQEGATTDLSITSLTAADKLIGEQTDPDGKPFPVTMDRLLVPRSLRTKAAQVANDTRVAYVGDDESFGHESNPWAGKFEVIDSVYLQSSGMGGGYSALAWYLLGNPDDLHYIELNFLNGRQEPFIESTDVDFDHLGIQTRGYFDFGADKAEYRAAFKSKGEA